MSYNAITGYFPMLSWSKDASTLDDHLEKTILINRLCADVSAAQSKNFCFSVGRLYTGSDYAPFYQMFGVSSADLSYRGNVSPNKEWKMVISGKITKTFNRWQLCLIMNGSQVKKFIYMKSCFLKSVWRENKLVL